jgi:hypothetical protein
MRTLIRPALVAGLVLALAAPVMGAGAADHLDSPVVDRADIDINDVYVFEGADPSNTVLAMTVSPLASANTDFGDKDIVGYQLRIDTDADAVEDITYQVDFITQDDGEQKTQIRRVEGRKATDLEPKGRLVASGPVGETLAIKGGGQAFTGLRSDPFFFDLLGFLQTVEGQQTGFDLGTGPDIFSDLNTLSIVIEVPDSHLGANIGVWGTTSAPNSNGVWQQVDRMGRPAINTVVNSRFVLGDATTDIKKLYNSLQPKDDKALVPLAVDALKKFSALGGESNVYSDETATAIANLLLPDVVTYDTSTVAVGPLNGRALADDVIDVELGIVTNGAVTTDNVAAHDDYLTTFPYLGTPNS